jgi:hypothetical protein
MQTGTAARREGEGAGGKSEVKKQESGAKEVFD